MLVVSTWVPLRLFLLGLTVERLTDQVARGMFLHGYSRSKGEEALVVFGLESLILSLLEAAPAGEPTHAAAHAVLISLRLVFATATVVEEGGLSCLLRSLERTSIIEEVN